jgi:polyphosphate kinase
MPRNFYRRIEVVFPIEDGNLRERISTELLALALQDNVKARIMKADGTYHRPQLKRGEKTHRSQAEFIERTVAAQLPHNGATKTKYAKVKLAPRPKLKGK